MQPWLKWTLIVVVAVLVLYGGLVAFAEYSTGASVNVALVVGTDGASGKMFMRCDPSKSSAGVCDGSDQTTVTVHKRDRVHLTIHNADKGDHSHDFNVEGWQYAFPPVSPEMELHSADESWTFTAWATGDFHMLCELKGHDEAGMHGTFRVLG